MLNFIIAGAVTALGILVILYKIGLRRVLYWEIPIDVTLTIGIPLLMAGTYSGMMTAVFAGIFVTIGLRVLRTWFRVDDPDLFAVMRDKGWIK